MLVEKPLLLPTRRPAERLGRLARASGAIWYTSYNHRFEPTWSALKRTRRGRIGRLYRVRMFYGNGTRGNIVGTWRDSRLGVLEDMASHLIDLAGFVFGRYRMRAFGCGSAAATRLQGFDHCVLATSDRSVDHRVQLPLLEEPLAIEVSASEGALEMNGLTKWGRSELVILRSRLPERRAGREPRDRPGPDPTWAADMRALRGDGARPAPPPCENDLWLSRTVHAAAAAPLEGGA